MKITIALAFIAIILIGCKNRNPFQCSIDENVTTTNDSILLSGNLTESITRFIADFNEPKLRDSESKSFRLGYNSGDSFVITSVIRFEENENGAELIVKNKLSEDFKSEYQLRDTVYSRQIKKEEWLSLERVFTSNCYWTMPILGRTSAYSTFFLEAYDPEKNNPVKKSYHIVVRAFPSDTTEFGQILTKMFSYTDLSLIQV